MAYETSSRYTPLSPDVAVQFIFTYYIKKDRIVTTCKVKSTAGWYLLGVSIKHPEDVQNRIAGEKEALADAMKNHRRDFRKLVWEAYLFIESQYGKDDYEL